MCFLSDCRSTFTPPTRAPGDEAPAEAVAAAVVAAAERGHTKVVSRLRASAIGWFEPCLCIFWGQGHGKYSWSMMNDG